MSVGIPSGRAPARGHGAEHVVLRAGAEGAAPRPVGSVGPVRRARQRRNLAPSLGRRRREVGAARGTRGARGIGPIRELFLRPSGTPVGAWPAVLTGRASGTGGLLLLLLLARPVGRGAVRAHARAPLLVEVRVVLGRHAALVPLVVVAAGAVRRLLHCVRGAAVAAFRGGALPRRPALVADPLVPAAPPPDGGRGGRGFGVAPFLAGWQKETC